MPARVIRPPVLDRRDVDELRATIAAPQAANARAEAAIAARHAQNIAARAIFRGG